eukprot:Hpha_TRINITY_DN16206_c1_g2::TRINITY_DN16206_c1_g2_i1::g.15039::m.15039/K11268/ESCO, ECO1; N-acetyltransferase
MARRQKRDSAEPPPPPKRRRQASGGGGKDAPVRFKWVASKGTASLAPVATGACGTQVYSVPTDASSRNARLVAVIQQQMEDALGSCASPPSDSSQLFVAVCDGVVAGAAVAEELGEAWRMVDGDRERREEAAVQETMEAGGAVDVAKRLGASFESDNSGGGEGNREQWAEAQHYQSRLSSGVGVICGISRIWVHPKFRRRGMASLLVDAARRSLIYGYEIPRDACAFSQPTRDGKLFARGCTGRSDFFVYA